MSKVSFRDYIYDDNLIGIIPALSDHMKLNFEWPDYLMPIGDDYTLIENAVTQQAILGANSIWIVAERSSIKLLKERVGENIFDPLSLQRRVDHVERFEEKITKKYGWKATGHGLSYWTDDTKPIPIYYVALPPQDRYNGLERSDLWGVMYTAYIVNSIFDRFTSFGTPSRFLITNPYGIIPITGYLTEDKIIDLRALRDRIRTGTSRKIRRDTGARYDANAGDRHVLFTHNGKSAVTGNLLTFTMDKQIWEKMRKFVYKHTKVGYKEVEGKREVLMLKDFMPTIANIYEEGTSSEKAHRYETDTYFELNNYNDYARYMGYRAKFIDDDDKGLGKIDNLLKFYEKNYRPGRMNWNKEYQDLEVGLYERLFDGGFI